MKKVLISCGGTGGHLAPGIALAEGLIERGHGVLLLVSRKKVDARLLEKYDRIRFTATPGSPFSLRPARLVTFLVQQVKGLFYSFRIMREYGPDIVVGFGGFTSIGIAIASFCYGTPLVLHESNRVAGRATRYLRGLAARIYLPTGVRVRNVSPDVIRHYGCPVRSEIERINPAKARENLGLEPTGKLLVVFGGSQGAVSLNEWVRSHFDLLAFEGIHVFCITGMDNQSGEVLEAKDRSGNLVHARFVPFSDRIAEVLSAADLVVSRAGAGTIAELIRCRVPAILIPYPYAADNHQWANALSFEQQGGGLAIDQAFLNDLHNEVVDVIFNDWLLHKFRTNLERMDRENALERILADLERICGDPRSPGEIRSIEVS